MDTYLCTISLQRHRQILPRRENHTPTIDHPTVEVNLSSQFSDGRENDRQHPHVTTRFTDR